MTDLEALDQAHVLHPLVEWRKHEKDGPRIITGGKGMLRMGTLMGFHAFMNRFRAPHKLKLLPP